jgi:hypothetical protein
MRLIKPLIVACTVALAVSTAGIGAVSAGVLDQPAASARIPMAGEAVNIEKVDHRRYRRHRHGRRYRSRRGRHRHYHGGYWYVYPWWTVPPAYYSTPPRYYGGRCERWHRRCRANWGVGGDYRGCMRYHGCL